MREFQIKEVEVEDAKDILEIFLKCSDETDMLSCGSDERENNLESQEKFISDTLKDKTSVEFAATINGKIIGLCGIHGKTFKRQKHRANLGISILKEYWGIGVGQKLIKSAIEYFKNEPTLTKLELEVRSDNIRAIKLYEKFNFKVEGEIMKSVYLDGEYKTTLLMGLEK